MMRMLVYSSSFLWIGFGMALPGAELEWLSARVAVSESRLWRLFTARGLAYTVSSFVGGIAGDLCGRYERGAAVLMSISMVLAGAGTFGAGFVAETSNDLALCFTGVSIAIGALDTIGNMAVLRSCEAARKQGSSDMAMAHAAFGVGCFAAPTAALLVHHQQILFAVIAVACALNAIALLCVPGLKLTVVTPDDDHILEKEVASTNPTKEKKDKLTLVVAVAACCLVFFYVGSEQGAGALLATVAHKSYGLSPTVALRLTSLLWLALFLGRVACARVVQHEIHADRVVLLGGFLAVGASLAMALAETTPMLFGVVFLLGAAYGPIYPVAFARLEAKVGGFSASFGGLLVATGGIGEMILPPFLFYLWDHGPSPFAFPGGLALFSLVFALAWAIILAQTPHRTTTYNRLPKSDPDLVGGPDDVEPSSAPGTIELTTLASTPPSPSRDDASSDSSGLLLEDGGLPR